MISKRVKCVNCLALLLSFLFMFVSVQVFSSEGQQRQAASLRHGDPKIEFSKDGSQARLEWHAVDSASCILKWGRSAACNEAKIEVSPDSSNRCVFTITNLLPGHEFYYRITGSGVSYKGSFMPGKQTAKKTNSVKVNSSIPEEQQKDDKNRIKEFIVVSRRIPEESFKTDRSVSTVDQQALSEQNPRTVPEALWDSPGVYVQHTNLGGGSPIIRGMMGPQVLIMMDGIRFNNSTYRTGPGQYLNLIDPLFIEQIEVLRGPGSILYGSDAMGGVIQLTPFSGMAERNGNEWRINSNLFGSFNSADKGRIFNGRFSANRNNFNFTGGASYKMFDDLRGGREVGVQPYVGYDQLSAFGKGSLRFTNGLLKNWLVTFGYLFNQLDDAGRIDQLYNNKILQVYDNMDNLIYGRLEMEYPAINSTGRFTLSFQDFYEQKDEIKLENDLQTHVKTVRDQVKAGTLGLDINWVTAFTSTLQLNYGAMWYQDSVEADRLSQKTGGSWFPTKDQSYPDGSRYKNYGLYMLAEWEPWNLPRDKKLKINCGYRFHGVSSQVPEKDLLPAVDFSFTGHIFSFGAQYFFGDFSNLSLTFSQGFRAPNLQEAVMLGDTGKFFHIPNFGLKPESLDTLEFLLKSRLGRTLFSYTGYVSFLHDLIKRESAVWKNQTQIDGKEVAANVNGGNGIIWGTEGNIMIDPGGNFLLTGHITYTWGKEYIKGSDGVPLTRIPPLFGQLTARYARPLSGNGLWFVETFARAAGKQDRLSPEDLKDVRIPTGGTPGWWTLNTRGGIWLKKHFRLGLSFENILNKKYKYHASGIYNPGANVTLSFEYY